MKKTILIVEDSKKLAELFESALSAAYQVIKTTELKTAKEALHRHTPHGILLDIQLPDGSGLDLIPIAKQKYPDTVIIVITAFGTIQLAVEAMRFGAADFLEKPVDMEALPRIFAKHLALHEDEEIVFASKAMEDVISMAKRIAPLPFPVLITGETGVGKDMMARFIHRQSGRKEFVALNCANLTPELADSILFGHIKGSFTGATETKEGLVTLAAGGTLFLDELCELPLAVQAKLLRFLDSGSYLPLGGNKELKSDARILAATNQDPKIAAANGRMRQDLYYRLAVMHLDIPPLRERIEDIPPLVQRRLSYLQKMLGHEVNISHDAIELLTHYEFPGNVRELFNLMDRAATISHGQITPDILMRYTHPQHKGVENRTPAIDTNSGSQNIQESTLFDLTKKTTAEHEKRIIEETLAATRYNKAAAARLLGVSYKTLLNKLKRYGIL